MDGDLDVATLQVLAGQVAKDEAKATELFAERDALSTRLEVARTNCEALYTPEALTTLIKTNTPEANDVRLRLRIEIRRRVARIEFVLNATIVTAGAEIVENVSAGTDRTLLVRIKFVNGSEHMMILQVS